MRWIYLQRVRAVLSSRVTVGTGKSGEEIIKGMVLLDEKNNIFDQIVSPGINTRMERTTSSQGQCTGAGGEQELQKTPAGEPWRGGGYLFNTFHFVISI